MTTKYNQELTDHRNTKNKSEMYQRRKAKPVELSVGIQVTELKMSHHNHYIDRQNKMVEKELKEFINGRGNNDN